MIDDWSIFFCFFSAFPSPFCYVQILFDLDLIFFVLSLYFVFLSLLQRVHCDIFDFWVLLVQKIEFFSCSSALFDCGWVLFFLCKTKALIFIFKLHEYRFGCLLSLSKLKFLCVPEPSSMLFSLGFLAFWVHIYSIGYLCDRLQQRRKQIVSDIWRTCLWCISFLQKALILYAFFFRFFVFSLHVHCFL